jgi:phosphate transport system substrate-binding protein
LDPLVEHFLRYVLSREGQEIVVKDGFIPLAPEIVDTEMRKLE